MTTQTFTIPASRLPDVEKLIARFARKAAKLGAAAPAIVSREEFSRFWIVNRSGNVVAGPWDGLPACVRDDVDLCELEMVKIDVAGERPVIAGWSFAAVLERTEGGTLLRKSPYFEAELPHAYRTAESVCEHCRTRRARKETFVLHGVESGAWMQVGRQCLQDFLASASPSAWLAAYEFERSIAELCDEPEEGWGGGAFGAPVIATSIFVACAFAVCRLEGYLPASRADMKTPTGAYVQNGLSSTKREDRDAMLSLVTERDRANATAALAWIADADASGDSDFMHNLRVVAACPSVRRANLLASLVPSFDRELSRKAEVGVRLNEHLPGASAGSKFCARVTVVRKNVYEHDHGWTSKISFEDADGRLVFWSTSSSELAVGDVVILRGAVKSLSEFNGRLQTIVTRCKYEIDAESAAA
jgi:hypothetical protein